MEEELLTEGPQRYRKLGQGLKIFHDHEHAEVDIVAVPGLGANPTECWTWTPTISTGSTGRSGTSGEPTSSSTVNATEISASNARAFNWIRDPEGLASLYNRSRIMLFNYASAWTGGLKVKATMKAICTCLLEDLSEKRKAGAEATRPLLFIGHSMGGVVIAKALCMAKARQEWEAIVICTIGCAFFGAPFKGSEMARTALIVNSAFGSDAYESLISFMQTEGNDALDEVKNDFVEITTLHNPPIELLCVWEQVSTDLANFAPNIVGNLLKNKYFKLAAQKMLLGTGKHFVERDSAVLHGAREISLPSDHRDLVKFKSVDDPTFASVKKNLSDMISPARINVRKRLHSSGQVLLNQRFVNQVRLSLEGVDMRQKLLSKSGQNTSTSWLASESSYNNWLKPAGTAEGNRGYLWLNGGPGLGKTNAALATIHQLEDLYIVQQRNETHRSQTQIFLAYFLCDWNPGFCTAEDVLKNLIIQMIYQEQSLAQHAKWFVPNSHNHGPTATRNHLNKSTEDAGTKATTTVDNLWKCVQDMIEDPAVTSAHFVLSNIHCLEASESTTVLLRKLSEDSAVVASLAINARKAKWLLTSRKDVQICRFLSADCVAAIDLESNDEYGRNLRSARREYARNAIANLRSTQQYSTDLAYYVRNSVESQSEDESWIGVLCLLLGAMPKNSSTLTVRKWLREVANLNINRLIDLAWTEVLERNSDVRLEMEELLQAITIAYEPPTVGELSMLTGIDDSQLLRKLIEKSSPILRIPDTGENKNKVVFSHPELEAHLKSKSHGHPDQTEPQSKQYHGLIAIRCFKYIKTFYQSHDAGTFSQVRSGRLHRSLTTSARATGKADVLVVKNDDEGSHDMAKSITSLARQDCRYPLKYIMHHLNEGFSDAVDELFEEDLEFWNGISSLRDAWLRDWQALMPGFKSINTSGMSALHVASAIEAADLVSVLVTKCGKPALSWTSDDGRTPLHIAALNKRPDVVDKLIRAGADIEAGDGDVGTPLHFAALHGRGSIIALLLKNGANVNAFRHGEGPVINAAIKSGTVDAVRQIMSGEVRFDVDYTKCESPLSLSAGQADPGLFKAILESEQEKWLQNAKLVDQALISASESGRLESVQVLLDFKHVYTNNTLEDSLLCAARAQKWSTVDALLTYAIKDIVRGNRRDLRLDRLFYRAAASKEHRLDILQKIWKISGRNIGSDVSAFSLYQACILRKTETAKWLLDTCGTNANVTSDWPASFSEDDIDVVLTDTFGNALNAAAATGNTSLVQILVDRGANINNDSDYALQLAAKEGHTEVVTALLALGVDPNHQVPGNDEIGFNSSTALQAACENDRRTVVEVLLQHHANPNLGGGIIAHPIVAAAQLSEPDILMLLLETPNIDINVSGGHDQSTPLVNAAARMSTEVLDKLIQKGADVDVQNASGETALIMAARRGDKECVELLCNRDADVTYRSLQHGLAVQVAAQKLHPLCADILSERMGKTIEDYREREKLNTALLQERYEEIQGLSSDLSDAKESLESANGLAAFQKTEIDRLQSMHSYTGSTFGSQNQQLRFMQSERTELLKQIDSERGLNEMKEHTIAELKAREEKAHQQIADLRKRQGFVTLQEEKKAALQVAEDERQKAEGLQQDLLSSHLSVEDLEGRLQSSANDLVAARESMKELMGRIDVERLQKQDLENELEALRNEHAAMQDQNQEVQRALVTLQEAQARKKAVSPPVESAAAAPSEPATERPEDYFGSKTNGQATNVNGNGSRSVMASPGPLNSHPASPQSPSTRLFPGAVSPSVLNDGGFRTIHGQHRADGSLGGYRAGKGMRRASGGLNKVGGPSGSYDRSMSTESLGSKHSSLEAPVEEIMVNGVVASPKDAGDGFHRR